MQKICLLFSFLSLIYTPCIADAQTETITVAQSYKMGNNDSLNEALHICAIEASASVLKKAAAYIAALDTIKYHQLSQEELKAYTTAALRVNTTNKKWLDMAVTITAATDIDPDYIEKMTARIKSDQSLQNQFKEQQQQRNELEQALAGLRNKLKPASFIEADDLRKKRNEVIRKIEAIETKRLEIINEIIKKSLDAKKKAAVRMTMKNIESLLGEPDAKTYENHPLPDGETFYVWYYGYTRIYFTGKNAAIIR